MEQVLNCNVYCTSVEKFGPVNAVYSRYFLMDPAAHIFIKMPAWFGPFGIEFDCIAVEAK